MNIFHLSAAKNWGGGENHILNLCDELHKENHHILCLKNSGIHQNLLDKNHKVFTSPLTIKLDLRYVLKIINICKKEKIDIIHIHDTTALTLAVMATKLAELPPFVFSKKTSFNIKDRKRTLYKYNHHNIKKILCVSEETKKITAKKIEDKKKLVRVYHGTTMEKSDACLFQIREKFNIPENKILVGTIANHIRAKNLKTWISLIDYLVNEKKITNIHFVQIGNFTSRSSNYFQEIEKKGLNTFVSFTGFVADASTLIPQFDISLLTSQSEGIPQFIYESFYHKVPVVSTNVGGIPEIAEDGENAMLSNPYEAESLADKLIALSQDKILMKKFTERSYQKLIENFTTKNMAEQTLAEYKKVLYGEN